MTNLSYLLKEKQMTSLISKDEISLLLKENNLSYNEVSVALSKKELISFENLFYRLSYNVSNVFFDDWKASNIMYAPSYVSDVSALHNAEFIPDVVGGVICSTLLPSKKIVSTENNFFYYKNIP